MSAEANLAAIGFAPGFVGYIVCLSLYGTTLAQSIVYFYSFPHDSMRIKLLVSFLCVADTLHVCLLGNLFWNTFIYGRLLNRSLSSDIPWQLLASFIVESVVITTVQFFFCLRVWRVSENLILTLIIGMTSAFSFSTSNAFTLHNLFKGGGAATLDDNTFPRLQMASSMICDFLISSSLVYYFHSLRVGMTRTEPVIHQLIILSVNVGVLLCLVTSVSLVLFEVKAGTFFSLAPQFVLSKLYVNSCTATLNARKHFREVVDRSVGYSISMNNFTPTLRSRMES